LGGTKDELFEVTPTVKLDFKRLLASAA